MSHDPRSDRKYVADGVAYCEGCCADVYGEQAIGTCPRCGGGVDVDVGWAECLECPWTDWAGDRDGDPIHEFGWKDLADWAGWVPVSCDCCHCALLTSEILEEVRA